MGERRDAGLTRDTCLDDDQSGLPAEVEHTPIADQSTYVVAPMMSAFNAPGAAPQFAIAAPAIAQRLQGRAVTEQARRPQDIDTIVIHTPEGGEAATLGVLNGTRAAFDFFLPLNGTLYQCNDYTRYIAWQAGDWSYNVRSIGIEQGDFAANSGNFSNAHYDRLARLVAHLIQATNTPLRHATTYGENGLIAHATIRPSDRTDPGPNFKWDQLIETVQEILDGQASIIWENGFLRAVQGGVARSTWARSGAVVQNLTAGQIYAVDSHTVGGELVAGSALWYHLSPGGGWVHSSGGHYSRT